MTRHWEVGPSGEPGPALIQLAVVDAMAEFCEALQGRQTLAEGLAHFVRSVGAECGMIVRTQTNEMRPLRVAVHDERRAEPVRPLVSSYADGQFGPPLLRPRPASLWLCSVDAAEPGSDPHPALAEWQAARRMREFAVLVLAATQSARDHVELHFRHELTPEVQAALTSILPTLARSWGKRQVGVVTRTVACHRTRAVELAGRPVLGEANPHHLSRAEFRVCLLLSRGLSVEGVSAELGLARSTVRSHLRSIYAKTGVTSPAELVFRLLETREAEPRSGLRTA